MNIRNTLLYINLLVLSALASAVANAADETTFYYHDQSDSIVAAADQSGTTLWTETYLPYGQRTEKLDGGTNSDWYTGHSEDAHTGLTYTGARWYDNKLGRFHGMDSFGVVANDYRTFNRYAYANNNPYKFVDPDGRLAVSGPLAVAALYKAAVWTVGAIGVYFTASVIHQEVVQPAIDGALHSDSDSEYGPTKNRVKPRKGTKEAVTENQPTNEDGELVDPYSGEVLDPAETDLGHVIPWREKKRKYEEESLSREEVIERENDPSNLQWEDRSSNRSHENEPDDM